jgi:beta-glucanase (GH16 family)
MLLATTLGCTEDVEKNDGIIDEEENEVLQWELVWADEFESEEIDESKWNKLRWRPGWVNNEQQAYTDRDINLYLDDGNLVIQGLIEPGYYGTDYTGTTYNSDYTSGRMNTDDKVSWTYGRFDIRAKLPKGKGSWPAIWMLGENISTVGWPNCGEIDIMEHVGFDDGRIHASIHTEDYNHMNNTQKSGSTFIETATDSFHIYSLEWSPTYLRYLIDNESYFFVYNGSNGDVAKWPFDEPQYIILNLAIGGDWGAIQGIDPSAFPMKMLVDYVRVYKMSENFNNIQVTFQVDMKNETVNGTGVWLSGGNISFGQPGGLQMQPVSDTGIWQTTLTLPPNSSYTYKFRNGFYPDTWSGGWESLSGDCGTGQHNDRSLSVGISDTTMQAVCFGECIKCEE